jgi:hypothetical protein
MDELATSKDARTILRHAQRRVVAPRLHGRGRRAYWHNAKDVEEKLKAVAAATAQNKDIEVVKYWLPRWLRWGGDFH